MRADEAQQAELEQRRRDEEREWANKQLEADPEYTNWINKTYEEYINERIGRVNTKPEGT